MLCMCVLQSCRIPQAYPPYHTLALQSCNLVGSHKLSLPIMAAPTALLKMAHDEGKQPPAPHTSTMKPHAPHTMQLARVPATVLPSPFTFVCVGFGSHLCWRTCLRRLSWPSWPSSCSRSRQAWLRAGVAPPRHRYGSPATPAPRADRGSVVPLSNRRHAAAPHAAPWLTRHRCATCGGRVRLQGSARWRVRASRRAWATASLPPRQCPSKR